MSITPILTTLCPALHDVICCLLVISIAHAVHTLVGLCRKFKGEASK